MASVTSNWLGNAVLQQYFVAKKAYLALHVADPTVLGSAGSELAGGDYVRQWFKCSPPSNKTVANAEAINFDNLPLATISHLGWWTAASGGNFLVGHKLSSPVKLTPLSARLLIPALTVAVTL